jgi:hypothetical protein
LTRNKLSLKLKLASCVVSDSLFIVSMQKISKICIMQLPKNQNYVSLFRTSHLFN